MKIRTTFIFCFLVLGVWTKNELQFPECFKFGAATSSYQIEGGWNASDKSSSIWDVFVHEEPEMIADHSTGDVACDSYHKWNDDIQIASNLSLDFYRFSISWPRILPTGLPDYVSNDGYNYYNNLIDGLLEKGIEPMVTIYHWDLPQRLQNLGGWANPLIVDWFGDYANVLFNLYGHKVKYWITINEPLLICNFGFGLGVFAPGIMDYDIGTFQCNKNVVMAHARAYRIYEKDFQCKFQGRIGIANVLLDMIPSTKEDEDVTELARQFYAGIYTHPIFSEAGGWPPSIENIIAENSIRQGFTRSRLPPFTDEEIKYVKGTGDFFGINYYTSRITRRAAPGENITDFLFVGIPELDVIIEPDLSLEVSASPSFYVYPKGLRSQLLWVKKSFGDIEIIITENGYASKGSNLTDYNRVNFIKSHLEQVLLAIYEDNVKVTGYTSWSMMDNFEWTSGYQIKFGLYEVDFEDPLRKRTPRLSAHYYAHVIQTRSLEIPKNYK